MYIYCFVTALLDQYDDAGSDTVILRVSEIIIVMLTVLQFIWAAKLTMNEMPYMNLYTMTEMIKSCPVR